MPSYNYISYLEKSIKENWNVLALADYRKDPITYGDLGKSILRLHSLFEAIGIKRGDKIALLAKNSVSWAEVFLAAISYGAAIVPLLPDFRPEDAVNLVNHSDTEFLFVSDFLFDKLDSDGFENLKAVFSLERFDILKDFAETKAKVKDAEKIFSEKYADKIHADTFKFEKHKLKELMILSYTSGTSGTPKGVMLSHRSIAANVWYARKYMPLKSGDPVLSFLPLAHMYGCAFEFLYPLTLGCFVTFLGRIPSPSIVLEAFAEVRPRLILTVPLVIEKVYKKKIKPRLQEPKIAKALKIPILKGQVLKKIRQSVSDSFGGNFIEIVIGGAPLNPEVEEFFKMIKLPFSTGYGMTECGPLISYAGWKKRKMYSAGKKVDTLKVKVLSPDPHNIPGEIVLKGDPMMDGYYKNEQLTREVVDEVGMLHTGDLGIIGRDGTIFIKGRKKSMILGASGQNIYPEEIEAAAGSFPLVSESLAVEREGKLVLLAYPDEDASKQNPEATKEEVIGYLEALNEKLPTYMHVSKIEIMDEPFEVTPKKSIKRFLYTEENYQIHKIKN